MCLCTTVTHCVSLYCSHTLCISVLQSHTVSLCAAVTHCVSLYCSHTLCLSVLQSHTVCLCAAVTHCSFCWNKHLTGFEFLWSFLVLCCSFMFCVRGRISVCYIFRSWRELLHQRDRYLFILKVKHVFCHYLKPTRLTQFSGAIEDGF